ncbi:MAG: carbohydrate binding domain-containing protein, partial [Abitibacteriaceae bacterium]|nr:carbohydrate binding domain-containing protein [Abditibacteriaceae bacterium]
MQILPRYNCHFLVSAAIPFFLLGSRMPSVAQTEPQAGAIANAPNSTAMFPFVIPWDDASKTITDVSSLNPAPLDESRRISIKNGHFRDATGRRVRFIGTNFTFNANFPSQIDAEKVAARMHKYGFNIVRLHHMDFYHAPQGIFDPHFPDMQHLDADQLDRLDYLIYQFKKHGIYVDVNLHVSRAFTAADGFPDTDKIPPLGKVTVYFEPRMIELQKNYARDLLTHYNPYTKTRFLEDPTVALIEINNEDTLLGAAWGDTLQNLPEHYKNELVVGWNTFLTKKYGSTEGLLRAWRGNKPLGEEVLQNGQFGNATTNWTLETKPQIQAQMAVEDISGPNAPSDAPPADPFNARALPPGRTLHLKVQKVDDVDWHLQFHQNAVDLKAGETYTVQFWARAGDKRALPVYTGMDQDPWRHTGLDKIVSLTPQWKHFSLIFSANQPEPRHNRLSFVLGKSPGDVWLADVSLRPGNSFELEPKETLETSSISLPDPDDTARGVDYVTFLMNVERDYAQGMRDYIKNTLKAQAPVTCSQASYGGLGGVWRESQMDYIDMHAYWQHPNFPHKAWDPQDWTVANTAMVADAGGGTLPWLAMHRVEEMPFTVSEYNHAAPNDYTAETLPVIASYAAWQDWDGFFLFDYNGSRDEWASNRIKGYFSVDTHPGKMALMPAAAEIFLRGYLNKVKADNYDLVVNQNQVANLTAHYGDPWKSIGSLWDAQNIAHTDMLSSHVGVRFDNAGEPMRVERALIPAVAQGWFDWNAHAPQNAVCTVRSPGAKMAVGFIGGKWTNLDDLNIAMDQTPRNFATVTLTAMDGKPTR